ncbi:uracil-DNA glycosylase [Aliiroseovarius sp. YM-037]|uniref:uracil-DNA glycosylase n=1 Tax=Aliiroseovarius sp. YM-037 TaxID=3341728 RepID=UPI003A7FB1E2
MEQEQDFHALKAMLDWQIELGATEAIGDAPVNRYEVPEVAAKPVVAEPAVEAPTVAEVVDPVALAEAAASGAADIEQLQAALAAYDLCELKRGARSCVFSDGPPAARVMIIGEAPGRDEDREGKPFVGRAGQLLDKMFAAIDMARDAEDAAQAIYITNILPWRPPQNRNPSGDEIAMFRPFIERHIALADPDVLVLMGGISCVAMTGQKGITRMRGKWTEVLGRPALPMFHPAYLLRTPEAKREAWHDLLMLQAKLREGG